VLQLGEQQQHQVHQLQDEQGLQAIRGKLYLIGDVTVCSLQVLAGNPSSVKAAATAAAGQAAVTWHKVADNLGPEPTLFLRFTTQGVTCRPPGSSQAGELWQYGYCAAAPGCHGMS
jgi:hypothetical protein